MPDLTTSADIDAFLAAANDAAARTELGLGALATVTPGTGVAAALAINVGSAGAPVLFNGAGGTPSSLTGTNITGTAAGLTAGTASAVAVGGITGLGTGVGTFLATPSSANLASTVTGETGSGALVFGTSPTFTTSVVTDSTTLAVFNTVATTVNAFGVATTLNIGASAATVLNFGGFTSAAELRFLEPSGSGTNYSGFKQAALAASITYTLPTDAPANGDVLTSQSNGTLSWETPSGAANAVTAASTAAGAGLLWVSGGADRSATATDTVTTVNTTNLTAASVLPTANDGAALGASGTAFSDLFLASGAVINFNAGNLTLTHSAGVLTSNGAYVGTTGTFGSATSLLVGTAGSAVGSVGFRNATSGTITVAPTTGALGTVTQTLQAVTGTILCTGGTDVPVADGGTGLSSGTSGGILGFTAAGTLASSAALAANAIVIGGGAGATPTTTTTGAGVLTALGTAPNAAGGLVTVSTGTLNAPTITYTVEPGSDDTGYGERIAGILAGDTIAQWDLVYLDATSGRWELADADAAATAGGVLLGLAVASGTDGGALTVLVRGIVRNDGWTWASAGLKLYASTTPGGLVATTQPSGTDDVIRPVADTLSDDCIWFAPGQSFITHT